MRLLFVSFLFLAILPACSKKNDNSCPSTFKVTASNVTPTAGETVTLTASPERWNYVWNGPLNFFENQTSGANTVTLDNIKINQTGWYYGSLTGTGCAVLVDSVYIDVKYKQGNPPCSLSDNQVRGSSVPDLQATSVRKYYDNSFNGITLHGGSSFGYPTYSFIFNSYNGNKEPRDGMYVTTNIPVFNQFQDANVVVGLCQYGSYYFQTHASQTIYVTHVNGKLRISFCDLKYSGDNGNSVMVTATFSGQLTEK